ncbi:hypothetical protein RDWZM_009898 [Blomia tropicalis]|uniref:STAS domain-containing protein n=1 Tax=Blomia tropicalis TaxID=40697 RepID=A0A9Q0LYE7_BLOTA|nr:hypothetical protein RDWZM_009898 [Blomia tropicalis]
MDRKLQKLFCNKDGVRLSMAKPNDVVSEFSDITVNIFNLLSKSLHEVQDVFIIGKRFFVGHNRKICWYKTKIGSMRVLCCKDENIGSKPSNPYSIPVSSQINNLLETMEKSLEKFEKTMEDDRYCSLTGNYQRISLYLSPLSELRILAYREDKKASVSIAISEVSFKTDDYWNPEDESSSDVDYYDELLSKLKKFPKTWKPKWKCFFKQDYQKVVLYTTSLGSIRHTFNESRDIKAILDTNMIEYEICDLFLNEKHFSDLTERFKIIQSKDINARVINATDNDQYRIPVVFANGFLLGGLKEIQKLNETGKLTDTMNNYVNEMRNIGLEIDQFFENENDDFICKSDCPRCEGKEMLICTKCEDSATKELLTSFTCSKINDNGNINDNSPDCTISSCGGCEPCRSRTITISRLTYNMTEFENAFGINRKSTTYTNQQHRTKLIVQIRLFIQCYLYRWIPFMEWIQRYDLKHNLNADIMGGITIAVFQIPQCMGYSLLAGVPPIYGLYSSFLAPIFYMLLGTSRHCSIGTFAIISLMTGSVIADLSANKDNFIVGQSEIQIATIMALLIGLYQIIFSLLRLGFLAQFMSEQLTSGFICASSIYVLSSQLGYMTGIRHLKSAGSGAFQLIRFYTDLIPRLHAETNWIELSISIVCLIILLIWKLYLHNKCQQSSNRIIRLGMGNIPFELLLVIVFISTSWMFDMEHRWNISTLGEIPLGLPRYVPIEYQRIWTDDLWKSCIPLAIVAFAVTYSTGVTFGLKHGYEVLPNQELMAIGVTNTICSFFQCMPTAASLSRSALQELVGAKTQIASLVNSFVILIALLFLSPLLCYLPKCVLASIICVALKSLLLKAIDFKKYYRMDRIDGSIWIVSFISVLVFNVDLGLYIGLAYSLLTLIAKSQRPKTYMLGAVGHTNLYVPLVHYPKARELDNIRIFQFCGPLHFANVNYFKRRLAEKARLKSVKRLKHRLMNEPTTVINSNHGHGRSSSSSISESMSTANTFPSAIIIDCSMFSYIDATGITTLRNVVKHYESKGVQVLLSDVAAHVRKMMAADNEFHRGVPTNKIYLTIHDAVHRAMDEISPKPNENNNNNNNKQSNLAYSIVMERDEIPIRPKVKKKLNQQSNIG